MRASQPGPWHHLPEEFRSDIDNWSKAYSYLVSLVSSERAVLVTTTTSQGGLEMRVIGCLSNLRTQEEDGRVSLAVGSTQSREAGGDITLTPSAFTGGNLTTLDGDAFFALGLHFGPVATVFQDVNSL